MKLVIKSNNTGSSQKIPCWNCSSLNYLVNRRYEELYRELHVKDLEGIYKRTGCRKPCHYFKYWLVGEKVSSVFKTDNLLFSLNAVSNNIFVEREVLVYPWTSLVAEFGGSLGLFLGVSFMSLWDSVHALQRTLQRFQDQITVKFFSPTKILP